MKSFCILLKLSAMLSNNGGLQQIFDRRDQETFSMGRVGEKKSAKQVQEKHETSYSFKNYK